MVVLGRGVESSEEKAVDGGGDDDEVVVACRLYSGRGSRSAHARRRSE